MGCKLESFVAIILIHEIQETLSMTGSLGKLLLPAKKLWQGTIDGAVRISDLWAQRPYHHDDEKSDQRKDDRILYQPLPLFFWCEEHNKSFLQ